ncbi:carbon-nitrogen hydrolase family protein [Deinococcus sp. KNUC1210]|uniref:carbon-nitrogen hydrolase family protein n=1 Tax=Deinococcus sp. KNUC1210 TaxID=2917691 RepID=UPI001EF0555D|nr:carbon-nitrogen hydrolase family protein [Deinococcus sp. KNUC1210]ULH14335.1 carbon-nitrogen hydrolase family protein [Deinococcus sp. KNUC1210]
MTILHLAAAAYPVSQLAHWDEYEAKLSAFVAQGVAGGARLLVLPEYASLELVSLLPAHLWDDVRAQLPDLQALLPGFLEVHARLSRQHGVYLLAASFPAEAAAGHFVNRAFFFAPDGTYRFQDKQMMTRFEAEEWGVEAGEGLHVFETELGRIGVNICYDSEFPDFAALQVAAGIEVLLVPSFTGSNHGYHRVRVGSMARALEHQVYAVHAPCLADAPWSYAIETAVGAPAIYAPADNGLPETGIVAAGQMNVPGWLHAALDLSLTAEVRRDGHVLNARDSLPAAARARAGVDVVKL